jgi:hypothetical protein
VSVDRFAVLADVVAVLQVVAARGDGARVEVGVRPTDLSKVVPDEALGYCPVGLSVLDHQIVQRASAVVLVKERGLEVSVAPLSLPRVVDLHRVELRERRLAHAG